MIIELAVAKLTNKDVIKSMDAVSSLSSGITNILKRALGLTIYVISYDFLLKYLTIYKIESTVLQYVIGFIAIDFYAYWSHRWSHEYNILWNRHLVHHSSEEYNLPVALRQTISDFFQIYVFLMIPAAVFGIPTDVITILGVVMLFGGFWYHTQLIGKMGFLEKIIITPSHHRIHHAINPVYIDKNYGGILIIWDKIFGTFQEELPDVKPVFGITRPVNSWNPVKINFIHIRLLIKDAWLTTNNWDKIRIWFMPTGWRPADVAEKYPVLYTKDVNHQIKYMPAASIYLKVWAWAQLSFTFLLTMFLFFQMAVIPKSEVFVYGFFVLLTVYSYTSLMDTDKYAWLIELGRCAMAFAILHSYGGWFTLNNYVPYGSGILATYFVASAFISLAFEYFEFYKEDPSRWSSLTPSTESASV